MHLRFSTCLGMPVLDASAEHHLGVLSGVLIHPDTGKIEGFFVHGEGMFGADNLLFSTTDIQRWGARVYLSSADAVAPAEDRIRLQSLLQDTRTVLGQRIVNESGVRLGKCTDVQFNTETMHIEWLFLRKWFRDGIALPVSDIVEITPSEILVRDPMLKAKDVSKKKEIAPSLPEIDPAVASSVVNQ